MHPRLEEILVEKRNEVARLKKVMPTAPDIDIPSTRDFQAALSIQGKISLISEIKFVSPSAGLIREKTDPIPIGRIYEEAGAAAISFLTDRKFFGGDLNQLPRMKKAISLPILRKDFIMDEVQVREALLYGADAVLLIARILSLQQLGELMDLCRELGLAPLTEVHDRDDMEKAIECGAEIIGINNRDLDSFEVNTKTTLDLAPLAPENCTLISESGMAHVKDIQLLKGTGVHAVLIGSALMMSDDLMKKTRELVAAGIFNNK
ncbi:MAG: indole-3-glycerol phosphate synthase TrpC [Deltaproteobacteria bacterium]|nr:indole-3-glycerol phosphate synthase TrpC [Deltaproteobacteria bacterium]